MRILLALLSLAFIAPTAAAHGAPVVLDVEQHLLADEASDLSYLWDGFDITNVYVREAYHKESGTDGLIFRILASGVPLIASQHTLQIESDLTGLVELTSPDGLTWTGTHDIIEASVTRDETTQAVNVNLQVLVPMSLDQTLGPVTARALADDQLVDEAPGPMYLLGVPVVPAGEGTRVIESLALDGPDGYTDSTLSYVDGVLTVDVKNKITVTGQHIFVLSSQKPTATSYTMHDETSNGFAADVHAGSDPVFTLDIPATEPFQVRVQSDLGGEERFWVSPDGRVQAEPFAGAAAEPLNEESPSVPVALLLVGLAFVAYRRR